MKQFFLVVCIVFLIQLPNWYFILGRDGGGINDIGNENWIAISDTMNFVFSFPIHFFIKSQITSSELALIIYFIDLLLIAGIIHYIVVLIKRVKT